MHLGSVRLEHRALTRHRNRFVDGAKLEDNIDTVNVVRRDGNICLLETLEALLADLQSVDPALEIGKAVAPAVIGDGFPALVSPFVDGGNRGFGDSRIARVTHVPHY